MYNGVACTEYVVKQLLAPPAEDVKLGCNRYMQDKTIQYKYAKAFFPKKSVKYYFFSIFIAADQIIAVLGSAGTFEKNGTGKPS